MNKIIEFKNDEKKINKKKIAIVITLVILLIALIVIIAVYANNKEFRDFMDKYILRKDVYSENVPTIELNSDSNNNVIAFDNTICVLSENTLKKYNSSGKQTAEIKLQINNPVYSTAGKYLAIGEKNSQKAYLISGENIVWEKEVEGNISKINVNENGYVSIIVTGTTYKSVIITLDEKGNELFKNFLANTTAIDTSISKDNKYMAYAEINTGGTSVKSNVKIISIDNARTENEEPVVYTYEAGDNNLIINIKYQDKDRLVCMFDSSIYLIYDNKAEEILKLKEDNKKIIFGDIELSNYAIRLQEESAGLFSSGNTVLDIKNVLTGKTNNSTIEGIARDLYCYNDIVAINLGTEVDFPNTTGWLVKRYNSSQEVRNIVIGRGIAGIVYIDKIEIVNL